MPRLARLVAPGFPHHVVHRGNNREPVFLSDQDVDRYIRLLTRYSRKWRCPVLAYCLMSNHVHLLLRPQEGQSLAKMMQGISMCYAQHMNRLCSRTGRLWESRYYSCIVEDETHLWTVARYIEQNPVRAGVVETEEEFPYSSARAHILGVKDHILGDVLLDQTQQEDYVSFVKVQTPEHELLAVRNSIRSGLPLGSKDFAGKMEDLLQRKLVMNPRGRPKRT
ncbi:MAG: transposase [Candidatus Eisenbacteria bacterium]